MIPRAVLDALLATSYGEAAYRVVETIAGAGYEAWWVGGCVRDLLQEKAPLDIDIATSALPEQVCSLFTKGMMENASIGAARVTMGKHTFEITTFREENILSDGRHPADVVFSTKEDDAQRRDFTVNAMYYQPVTREVFDPYEGEADLKEALVRFIGAPQDRIQHDPLRLLRAVRLRSQLHTTTGSMGQYHPETYNALRACNTTVAALSGNRQLEELEKMLQCIQPSRALEDLWELGILQLFLPELSACKGIPQPAEYHHEGDVWDHLLRCIDACTAEHEPDIRLAALFHDCGKAVTFSRRERIRFDEHASASADLATKALMRLQMPKKRVEKIDWLIRHHMMMGSFDTMKDERKSHWYHHPWFLELTQLFWLDVAGTAPADFSFYNQIFADYQHFLDAHPRLEKLLLTGHDIMDVVGIASGADVGRILGELKKAQIEKRVTGKAEAEEFVKSMMKVYH